MPDIIKLNLQGEKIALPLDTIEQYNVSGPRYTSYPTAPEWRECGESLFIDRLRQGADTEVRPLSVYTHLPFCEERCHFCACNVVVTKKKEQAEKYLGYIQGELKKLAPFIGSKRKVVQYHWGGGTPTYLSEEQIEKYFRTTREYLDFDDDAEIAIETDPRVTTLGQLVLLRTLGFNRLSFGVQSFDPEVQQAIKRIQPFDMVKKYYEQCRAQGFEAVNFDLVYGLPGQTQASFTRTLEQTIQLKPDRIALYNFAYLPDAHPHQKRIKGGRMLQGLEKFRLFTTAIEMFTSNGYRFIGLDHFALESDELAVAGKNGTLHRNFMGHTTRAGSDLLALGVTSISMFDDAYFQNERKLAFYYRRLDEGEFPICRGIQLDEDDRLRRDVINGLLCNGVVLKKEINARYGIDFDDYFQDMKSQLEHHQKMCLILESTAEIRLTMLGRLFNRNVCMTFDRYLKQPGGGHSFSKTV
ncbi:oxygen-independent coproporphyrinogen III oxidase [Planctomycetota bacterium]